MREKCALNASLMHSNGYIDIVLNALTCVQKITKWREEGEGQRGREENNYRGQHEVRRYFKKGKYVHK